MALRSDLGGLTTALQKPVKPDVSYADLAGAKAGLRTTGYPLEASDREEVVALTPVSDIRG